MSSVNERLKALKAAELDYERGMHGAYGEERREMAARLTRIQRQIAMLTEDDRQPMAMPEQRRRFN